MVWFFFSIVCVFTTKLKQVWITSILPFFFSLFYATDILGVIKKIKNKKLSYLNLNKPKEIKDN
jgi:hypothetical protein